MDEGGDWHGNQGMCGLHNPRGKYVDAMRKDLSLPNPNFGFIGGVAQLGERLNGIQKVRGSIPLVSKKTSKN